MVPYAVSNKVQTNHDNSAKGFVPKNVKGFSIIELLVALVILSISFLALANVMITSIRVNSQNDYRNTAVRLTGETAENLLAQPIDSLANGATSNTVSVKIRGITLPYTVSSNVSSLTNDLKQINITVQYTHGGQSYSNNSVIYKHRAM